MEKEKTKDNFLSIENLEIQYKTDLETVYAVNNISFTLGKGETIGIIGETGAGKTTTALSILRLLPERTGKIVNGSIIFDGVDLLTLSQQEMREIRGKRISMIFQDPMTSLNPVLTVADQIAEGIIFHNNDIDKSIVNERVDEILKMVGIPCERKNEYPHQFSGGMKQRVVIAMALVCEPDLLIADEPTTALDVTIQAQVLKLMKQLKSKLNTSMILITHDFGIVAQMCDKVAVMYDGRIVEYGSVEDIFLSKSHHPYTKGLFDCIPVLNKNQEKLMPIPGLMSDPTVKHVGCGFEPRCTCSTKLCKEEPPAYYECKGHRILCHYVQKTDDREGEEKCQ